MKNIFRLCLLSISLLLASNSQAWVVYRGGGYSHGPYYHGYAYPRAVYYRPYYRVPYYGHVYYAPACRIVNKCFASGNCIQRRMCYY